MLFSTEEEYREYTCKNPQDDEFGAYGIGCDETPMIEVPISKPKEVFIYAETTHGIMWVSEKGVTFTKALAKKFVKDAGEKKAVFMSKRGSYKWKTIAA